MILLGCLHTHGFGVKCKWGLGLCIYSVVIHLIYLIHPPTFHTITHSLPPNKQPHTTPTHAKMPLWLIYHPPTTFTSPITKQALAASITEIYVASGLPAFYVNVLFIPVAEESYYIGGVSRPSTAAAAAAGEKAVQGRSEGGGETKNREKPFIRLCIQHLARQLPNDTIRDMFLAKVDAVLKPYVADMGYDWEYTVEELRRDLWKIAGLVPPMPGTEAEKEWVREGEAVVFEREKGGLGGKL
ncbi:Tautomerase [Pyrenophora seminiperda CCB06]|uniref:Tautomerase n=1 Tax=Pyrenophora seminiperda CCB06 TaxID=1302712 RepID=A0A3M7LV37_9PLEO|nr:Tautomerase [Pyrenophora seminiperda CCB06]